MSTEIYTDYRFTELEAYCTSPNISTHVIKGGGVNYVKRLVREKARLNHFSRPKLFIICIGINDIPEGMYDLSERRHEEIYCNLVHSFKKIKDYVQRLNRANRVNNCYNPSKGPSPFG